MVNPARAPAAGWLLAGHSVRGASHVRSDQPNQDALALAPSAPGVAGSSRGAIAAVADGHGGARHFRSAAGSRIAVDASVEVLGELAAQLQPLDAPRAVEAARQALAWLPARIVQTWIASVRQHLEDQPISAAEWQSVAQAEGDAALASVQADPLLAYGATLLAALATPACLVLLQLGDGDVLAVDAQGATTRPVPQDERLAGNLTTSICRSGAEADFRCTVLPADGDATSLLLLCTDGYANSFKTDQDFLKLGADFLGLTREHGLPAVGAQLDAILHDASGRGSGDDITLALLQRIDPAPNAPQAKGAVADAPPSPPSLPSPPAEADRLAAAERRIRRLRATVAVLALAVCALVAWDWRHVIQAVATQQPAAARPSETPPAATDRKTGKNGRPQPADGPLSTAGEAPAPLSSVPALLDARHVQVRRTERGVEVVVALQEVLAHRSGCSVAATVWGSDEASLGSAAEQISSGRADAPVRLLVRPADKSKTRAMQQGGVGVTVQLDCDQQTLARSERLAVSS